ncbi:MAG TPA: hypothetical protein PKD69_01545, partial [Elusimicrobiota bacterium]|nr:hypothetical protein [Elusimicrobiota bacterium]
MASSLKNKLIKQQFAALTAGCFLLTNLGTPYAQATTSSSFWESRKKTSDIKKELPDFSKPLELPDSDDGDLGFRLEDGLVKERFWPGQENPGPWRVGGRTLPFIVHVQDAHRNVDAQRTLGRLVRSLAEKNGGSALVCVEGAWGELDPGLLKVFPDRELRDRAAEEFLRVGWLTGEEHLAVTADDLALRLVGVDDPLLHRANRAARDRAEPLAGLAHRRLARLADRAVRRQAALWPQ